MTELKNYNGHRFGRWTVVARIDRRRTEVVCDCGERRIAWMTGLRSGESKSCGCLQKELASSRNSTHGLSQRYPKEYRAWCAARKRCNNPNHDSFALYGGRGIRFSSQWDDFTRFMEDMGECPPGATLDRIDPDGGYGPGNCRWADMKVQQNNRRNNHIVEHLGRSLTTSQWADEIGIAASTLRARLRRGWSVPDALTIGVHVA